jgi:tartrate-resistant acid phosphatase type 5
MRRSNSIEVRVDAPSKGLHTATPSDLQDDGKKRFLIAAENVRAESGELSAAPGHERVHVAPKGPADGFAGEPNLIHQPNLTSSDAEVQRIPIIGTSDGLYVMEKRARTLACPVGCSITFAAVADFGGVSGPPADVAQLVRSWSPDVVVAAGDLVYPDGGTPEDEDRFETQVAAHYHWAIGGYSGPYGPGPAVNRFLPALGNHDYDDGPLSRYLTFFNLPGTERYYTVKRGPVQFFFIDSYGYGPTADGPGGTPVAGTGASPGVGSSDLSSTGPQAVWLQQQLAASDCPWRVVVWHHPPETSAVDYSPGYAVMNWPLGEWGADVLITGHSHVYERIHRTDGVLHLITGWSGHSLREFSGSPVATSQFRYSADYGAVRFTVNQTSFTAEAINRQGDVVDSVTRTTERAFSLCYVEDLARQATQLDVDPATVSMPKGIPFPLRATAHFTDGSTADVTALSTWQSLAPQTVSVDAAGKVTGQSKGSATVRATYQGLLDTALVSVFEDCVDAKHDVAIVLDRSGSMRNTNPPQGTRLDRLKTAAEMFIASLPAGDLLATISFSDSVLLHHPLTSDFSLAREAVDSLQAGGNTNIADAVDAAVQELVKNGRTNNPKLLVLFTDGIANLSANYSCPASPSRSCGMSAGTSAFTAAKAAGVKCIVVSLDLNAYPSSYEDTVRTWPSCPSVYFPVTDANNLPATFVRLRSEVCAGMCSSGGGAGILLL